MKQLREQSEKFVFQAEVSRMMKLIINSLYRNKEVRIRMAGCVGVCVCMGNRYFFLEPNIRVGELTFFYFGGNFCCKCHHEDHNNFQGETD